jgi:hypothetical protein
MRPNHLLRSLAPIALFALAAAACNAVPDREDIVSGPTPDADVQVVLHGSRITPIFVSQAKGNVDADAPQTPLGPGKKLRWELLDQQGDIVDEGLALDPRVMRSEALGGAEQDSADVETGTGVLRLTMSGGGGTLRILEPEGTGWAEVGEVHIDPLPAGGERAQALVDLSTDVIGEVQTLVDHGDPSVRARILIVPEGYTEAELPQFHQDAANMAAKLATIGQFADYWDGFNIYMQDIRSAESGVADPVTGVNPTTAFEVTFGDDGWAPRRCTFYDTSVEAPVLAAVESLRQKTGADAVVVLANAEEYGGCASPANKLVIMTRNAAAPDVLAHELGHSLFNLADEYGGNSCDYTPTSANLTSSLSAIPWKDMLTTSELPTNPATASDDTVGAFDGGGYCDHGIYRPSKECMMRSLGHQFCPVCAAEVRSFFQKRGYLEGGGEAKTTTLTLHNETGAGLFARCPREPGAGCSDWTWMWAGDSVTIETSDPSMGFYIDNSTAGEVSVPFSWRLVTPAATDLAIYANAGDPLSPP